MMAVSENFIYPKIAISIGKNVHKQSTLEVSDNPSYVVYSFYSKNRLRCSICSRLDLELHQTISRFAQGALARLTCRLLSPQNPSLHG